jgi:hypothetical protein
MEVIVEDLAGLDKQAGACGGRVGGQWSMVRKRGSGEKSSPVFTDQ